MAASRIQVKDRIKKSQSATDFSKVGGLSNHLKILRDIIIVPLLHNNVYAHFNVKTPRGILFYGPPGTGKTLVAGALSTEINREGVGKVAFFQRKGADVLDKWVGESEKKLRTLFENAAKHRPSIIFFDELDGLAPIRTPKNDHVHCSIVTTLLALMDGLDSVPGVIVIGATNRIESVDPALRRPGRFDRELYFPLPSTEARKEILQVHTKSWKTKPTSDFLSYLAEITTGFCGSDLQALCAETILCGLKRLYPNIEKSVLGTKIKIEADTVKLDECDFLNACKNLVPACQKFSNHMRKLNSIIAPLLQNQLEMILARINLLWPHFLTQFHKYIVGTERYIGRLLLIGTNMQGLNTHIVPALLQRFEHLPVNFIEVGYLNNILNACQTVPSIIVLSRVDELWNFISTNEQLGLLTSLESIHAGLPILIIATIEKELPSMLQNFFHNSTSIIIKMKNPNQKEIESFLAPLFFGNENSVSSVLGNETAFMPLQKNMKRKMVNLNQHSNKVYNRKPNAGRIMKTHRRCSISNSKLIGKSSHSNIGSPPHSSSSGYTESLFSVSEVDENKTRSFSMILSNLLQRSVGLFRKQRCIIPNRKHSISHQQFEHSKDANKNKIFELWQRASATGNGMTVALLEVLYDSIAVCISIHKNNFRSLIDSLEHTLGDIGSSC